jgi:hypothetical protein
LNPPTADKHRTSNPPGGQASNVQLATGEQTLEKYRRGRQVEV